MTNECVINLGDGSVISGDSDITTNHEQSVVTNNNRQSNIKNHIPVAGSATSESPKKSNHEIPPACRLYFKEEYDTNARSNETKFECITEFCQPVEVNAANRFTQWIGDTTELVPGLYYIVLGVSTEKLNMSSIESISFSSKNSPSKSGPLETIKNLPKSQNGIMKLGLHHQYVSSAGRSDIIVDMEIRTRRSPQVHPGFFQLHYMELHAFKFDMKTNLSVNTHRPFLWSIDVGIKKDLSDIHSPIRPSVVLHYTFSGDGNYAATLSATDKILQLEMWNLKCDSRMTQSNGNLESNSAPSTPFNPRNAGQIRLPLSKIVLPANRIFMVSLSWDASKVSVVAENDKYIKDSISIFNFDKGAQYPADEKSLKTLTPYDSSRLDPKLRAYCGFGRFHITDVDNPDVKDQLFVTCDRKSVEIYSAHEQWSHLRTITDSSFGWDPIRILETVRAKYISWTSEQGVVYVCNLETGLIVTSQTFSKGAMARFSRDGSQMIIRYIGMRVSTRWTESGTAICTTDCCLGYPAYFQDDSRLILTSVPQDEAYGRGEQGAILDSTNMSIIDRICVSAPDYEHQLLSYGSGSRNIVALHGSKLDLFRVKDVTIKPYPQPRYSCDDQCFDELSSIKGMNTQSIIEGDNQFFLSSGLEFKAELRATSTNGWRFSSDLLQSIVIWVINSEGKSREALTIPPSDLGTILGEHLEYRIRFNATTQQMIVYSHILLMVWSLPTTLDGDFTLLATSWTQPESYQIEDKNDWLWTEFSQCTHGQAYLTLLTAGDNYEDVIVDIARLHYENVFMEEPHPSLEGALALVEMFDDADDVFKEAVLHYIGRYVNCYSNLDDLSENVIARICRNVTQGNNAKYARFLTALFESPHCRWVPRRDYNEKSNPISILLESTKKIPRAIDVAHVIINYCTRTAHDEKDPQFALALMEPLQELIDRKQLHTDVSLGTLRRLAFIPVNETGFVIDHNKIAHSPESWWRFWANNKPPLYECENPVWQLDRHPLPKPHDPLNDNFTRDIFVTSFDMLWRSPKEEPDTRAAVARIANSARTPQSWIRTMVNIILLKCKLAPEVGVVCHNFALESLDNPAIAALVEYKWNTIGYAYWLFRFVWQCIYYLLVLSAVFIQVYSTARDSLVGVFIAIITLATVFLWLEIVQVRHNPGRYFSSPYNYVDLVVFVLPLVGSCLQISNIVNERQGNTATLSFSVLFIFLHFLFELRINRGVCHFVTIIIRIMGKIRIFFFVFAAGLLAFTIAILHLLRACPVGDCDTSQVGFPSQFYSAFSSTYFFMGGIWDPISDNFKSDDWEFHTMMIIYFFFTTILLLNVLIALINVAFGAGDETWFLVWIENRLRYVESAESLTYNIPGFRDAHDWFPKEIYYSATLQEVKNYREKYFNKNDQDSVRSDASAQRLFGQASPAKKTITASVMNNNSSFAASSSSPSSTLTGDVSRSDDSQQQTDLQQQAIRELKNELIQVQEKTDKRVEDLQAQLAEMKRMLSLLCKEE